MAKPPTTERFKVSCEVEAMQLGGIVAHFTKMGLNNISYELITDVRTFQTNKRERGTSVEILSKWIEDHPTFKALEAAEYVESLGSTKGAAYPALAVLVDKKVLKKLSPGHYARADVKQIAAPKSEKMKTAMKWEIPHTEAILRLARKNHNRVTYANLKKHFKDEGRNPSSVHPAIGGLVKDKLVQRKDEGIVLLAKAMKEKPKKKAKTAQIGAIAKTNGADVVIEATNE